MAQFDVTTEILNDIPIIRVKGYYEKQAGQKVHQEAELQCRKGNIFLILDLASCDVLSSPGVSTIVELSIDLSDNYDGKLVICGMDKLKEKVLTLVGIQTMAEVAPSLDEAFLVARKLKGK